MLNFMKTS